MESLDGIFIYSETSKHRQILREFPKGVPVFIEKPLGLTNEDALYIERLKETSFPLWVLSSFIAAGPDDEGASSLCGVPRADHRLDV